MYYNANQPANIGLNFVNNFNGNINATEGIYKLGQATNTPDNFGTTSSTTYQYFYDDLNRLTTANAEVQVNGLTSYNYNAENGDVTYSFDKIGNLIPI